MSNQRFTEKDWQLFRKKIIGWQESYMDKLNKEYIELLDADVQASDRFWSLAKRIREDQKSVGVQIDMRQSTMIENIVSLIDDHVIDFNDLEDFSDELKESVHKIFDCLF